MKDIYINFDATKCSMKEIISLLRENNDVEKICRDNSINISLLGKFLLLSGKGYNNSDIARKLGVHRITVQRYCSIMRQMKQSDYIKLLNFIFSESKEERNKNEKTNRT